MITTNGLLIINSNEITDDNVENQAVFPGLLSSCRVSSKQSRKIIIKNIEIHVKNVTDT